MKSHKNQYLKRVQHLVNGIDSFLLQHPDLMLKVDVTSILDFADGMFDILIKEQLTQNVRLIINVAATEDAMDCYNRLLIKQVIFPIDEIFVYDFQTGKWLGNNCSESSYSFILKLELSTFL